MTDLLEVLRTTWGWTGIDPKEVVLQNEFGNLIVRDAGNQFWRICPEDIYCEVVADSERAYRTLLEDKEFGEDWKMAALVESARKELGPIQPGCVYHMTIPGPLGGKYDLSNIRTVPLTEAIGLAGEIGLQIRDLPEGTQVKIRVPE